MPEPEEFGTQPPIELLRQWLDYRGWYEHKKDNVDFKEIQEIMFYCAMPPPGGGRHNLTPRFCRHFNIVTLTPFDESTMTKIFGTLVDWLLSRPDWPVWGRNMGGQLVRCNPPPTAPHKRPASPLSPFPILCLHSAGCSD